MAMIAGDAGAGGGVTGYHHNGDGDDVHVDAYSLGQ